MTTPMDDDNLLSLLSESLTDNQPPADAIEAAYAAYGWRTLEADLARLIEDNQIEVAGFREAAFSRVVAYETDTATVEVLIDNDVFEVRVDPVPPTLRLRQTTGTTELTLDDTGRARAHGVSGPVRFEVSWPDGKTTLTPWLTL